MRTSLFWALAILIFGTAMPAPAQKNEGIKTLMPPFAPPVVAPSPKPIPLPPPKDAPDAAKNDLRRFESLRAITARHAGDEPNKPESRAVAKAFVALANYYLQGIPNSPVQADPARARELLAYAGSYFRDADAQYQLGRLDLEGIGGPPNAVQAARWLSLAAKNDPHQAGRGLMLLTLAREAATPDETWIRDLFDAAIRQATPEEKAQAFVLLEGWLKEPRN